MSNDHLFTLRVKVRTDRPMIVIRAFDGGAQPYPSTHHRIDVSVHMGGKVIFAHGDTWCAVPGHVSIDGIDAKELVMSLVAMKPGDTDEEYFAHYSPEQIAFAEEYGEDISCEREARYRLQYGRLVRS